jgi:hypothetical protein
MKILFLHGLESMPGGSKAQYLEGLGHDVLNPHLPKGDFDESVMIAQEYIDQESPDVIVGSSRGGAVAMSVDLRGARLVLIAPAWKRFDVPPSVSPNTTILHCTADDIVHYEDSEELTNGNLIPCGDGHRMSDVDALEALGRAVGGN